MNLQQPETVIAVLVLCAIAALLVLRHLWGLWFWPRCAGTVVGYHDDGDGEAMIKVSFADASGQRHTIRCGGMGAMASARKKYPQGATVPLRVSPRNPAGAILASHRILWTFVCIAALAACAAATGFILRGF